MGIHSPYATGTGYDGVTAPVGSVWSLIDPLGEVYNAGYAGATRNHPLQIGGGENINLGALHESAVDGWNASTGVVTQTRTGLYGVCDATNPTVIIDLPVYKSIMPSDLGVMCTLSCTAPATGNYVGSLMTSNKSAQDTYSLLRFFGVVWNAQVVVAGAAATSGLVGVAASDLGAVYAIGHHILPANTVSNQRNMAGMIWGEGVMAPLDFVVRTLGTAQETVTDPYTTYDQKLVVNWAGGSPFVFEFHYVSLLTESLAFSTVD